MLFEGLTLSSFLTDITWFGKDLNKPSWDDTELRTICYQLDGGEEKSDMGDYQLFIILNADFNPQSIKIPILNNGMKWYRVIDTSLKSGDDFLDAGKEILIEPSDCYFANARSTVVLIGK